MFRPPSGGRAPAPAGEGGLLSLAGRRASWEETDPHAGDHAAAAASALGALQRRSAPMLVQHQPQPQPQPQQQPQQPPFPRPPAAPHEPWLAAAAAAAMRQHAAAQPPAATNGSGSGLSSGVLARAPPGWHESYSVSTVLVAHVTNLRRATQKLDPEDELLAYHRVTAALDRVLAPERDTLWKVARYELPYYCAMCPAANTHEHADALLAAALRLLAAARTVELPNGERAALQLGICTGAASAGIIGSECMSFIVTGPAARAARRLADCPAPLNIAASTYARLGPSARAVGGWAPRGAVEVPFDACVEAYSLKPPGYSGSVAAVELDLAASSGGRGGSSSQDSGSKAASGDGADATAVVAAPFAGGGAAACDGSCGARWTAGGGFLAAPREAEFTAWHSAAMMDAFDLVTLLLSIITGALVLARRPARHCPPAGALCHPELALLEAVALLGPAALLLLLRLACADLWAARREQICCAAKLIGLVLRAAVGALLGAAPAAAAAAAARGGLPLSAAPGTALSRAAWLSGAVFGAVVCKLRLQSQLLVSGAAVALAAAAAARDLLLLPPPGPSGPPAECGAAARAAAGLLCVGGMEALRLCMVYCWDAHLRAEFLKPPAAAASRPSTGKAKAA